MGALEHLPALFRELGLALVANGVGKVKGLVDLASALALARPNALGLLELLLDSGGLGEVLGVNGLGDVAPEGEGLVGRLLLLGREDLGGDLERRRVDDGILLLGRDLLLEGLC